MLMLVIHRKYRIVNFMKNEELLFGAIGHNSSDKIIIIIGANK